MDTKASFLSALNAAVLGFIWTGAKFADAGNLVRGVVLIATVFSIISLFAALFTVFPRGSLKSIFGGQSRYTEGFKGISFYGYVVSNYPKEQEVKFFHDVEAMDAKSLCREALEQHYTISHSVLLKEKWVSRAGICQIVALVFVSLAFALKFASDTEATTTSLPPHIQALLSTTCEC
jgi:hypothetical protein